MREASLNIRMSSEDKQTIEMRARDAHVSTSEYIRRIAFQDSAAMSESTLKQKIVQVLCLHAQLVNDLDSPLREEFVNWEETVWQFIR